MTTEIQRIGSNERLSRIVIHNNVVYLSGVTASNHEADIHDQTVETLKKIDAVLAEAGTSKSRLLTAQIWLRDIDRDFSGMNAVWSAWLDSSAIPTRATGQAYLAHPGLLVEVIVTAAL